MSRKIKNERLGRQNLKALVDENADMSFRHRRKYHQSFRGSQVPITAKISQDIKSNKEIIAIASKPEPKIKSQVVKQIAKSTPKTATQKPELKIKSQVEKQIAKSTPKPTTPKHIIEEVTKIAVANPYPEQEKLVELRNVNVQFGLGSQATKAMIDANIDIYKGEVLGLVGESGSGKSTTGRAIMGLLDRQTGTIKIDKIYVEQRASKIKLHKRKQLARRAQMIFQDPTNSLNPQKTIKKVISEGIDNINVKEIFSKQFDIYTTTNLFKLLKGKQLPQKVSELNLENIISLIEKGKLKTVYKKIYEDARKELREFDTPSSNEAATFLHLRSKERAYYLNEDGQASKKKIKEKIIDDMISSVGLSKQILNRYPLEFSGGQQQRISISRSLVVQPELLVADEPISALDVSIQAQVINILNDLKKKMGLTILFIAHDLRMVEYISNRIIVMYKGRILESGPAKVVVQNPIHPYTKILMGSVPSIDRINQKIKTTKYDPSIHKYTDENNPNWYEVDNKKHFVYGTLEEVSKWLN